MQKTLEPDPLGYPAVGACVVSSRQAGTQTPRDLL